MKCLVTGGAGFIGSNLTDRLIARGDEVAVFDNLSSGQEAFLAQACSSARFRLIRGDVGDFTTLCEATRGIDIVFHLAANADVRFGTQHPRRDLDQNTIATWNVLEAMRVNDVRRIVFSSTGSIYGEPTVFPTPEDSPFPVQTSLYGASKLAAEGLISAYSTGFGLRASIFRFVSILGQRYSHGHVFDFLQKLRANPEQIEVLGNGLQRKSYLHVQDCIDAILLEVDRARDGVRIYNLGTDEYCTVNDSLGWICDEIGLTPERVYTGGERGWIGDSPFIFLDCSRMRAQGWTPSRTIRESVRETLHYLQSNAWLLEPRV